MKRPEKKDVSAKVSEEDMIYFSLGIDRCEFILPSQRLDYHSDSRAVRLVRAVREGKKLVGEDFSGVNLKGADISGGVFAGCNFKGATFYKTNAETGDFSNCCFDDAYFEDSDFMGCDFTGATFKHVFSKNNNWEKAFLDDEAFQYLSTLEQIIRLIEQGKIDIRTLSKSDLIRLDIRRLDFSKIDLEDLDLSMFALDGINLSGTYIDPKQLMSLEGWNSYCLDLRKTKEMTRERLCRKVMTEKEEELRRYAQLQHNRREAVKTKKIKRPEMRQSERAENRAWGIEKARMEFAQMQQAEQAEMKKREMEEKALFEQYQKEYGKQEIQKENVSRKQTNQEVEIGIRVTPENIKALDSELKTEIPFSLVSKEVGCSENSSGYIPQEEARHLKEGSSYLKSDLKNQMNNQIKHIQNKDEKEKKEPILIVAHETSEKRANVSPPLTEMSLNQSNDKIESGASVEMKPTISTTPYPYFKDVERPTEKISVKPKKPASDDEETIHDLKNAGYTMTEITQMLRQKGPLKVMGKLQAGRKVNNKTKG